MIESQLLNLPEKYRMLELFAAKSGASVYVYELTSARPIGLGISQYGRCIKELREAGHPIINVCPGEFRYALIRHNVTYEQPVDTYESLEEKMYALAEAYEVAPSDHKKSLLKQGGHLREVLDKGKCLL
jgi:hypothetical protein